MAYSSMTTNLNKTNDTRVSYRARDFSELKTALMQYAETYFPNSYKDFNDASPGMMFIEMGAYVGDVLNFYIDKQYQEMLLPLAQERKNVINLARMLGYKYNTTSAAYVTIEFTQEFTADTSDINDIHPLWSEAAVIPKGTRVYGGNVNRAFETLDVVDFTMSSSMDPSPIQSETSADGLTSKFTITRKVNCVGAETNTVNKYFQLPSKFATITIKDKVSDIISVTDSNGNNWYEVDYLAQDRVPIETHYTSDDDRLTAYSPLTGGETNKIPVPYKLQFIKTTKRFTTHNDINGNCIMTFGNGIIRNGQTLESSFLQTQQVGINIPGVTDNLTDAIDATLGDEYDTLGETPTHTTLNVTYRRSGGLEYNVTEGVLNSHNYGGTSSGQVSCTNPEPARGASQNQSTLEIKHNALANFKAQNRCVTREDYEARILHLPAKFGNVSKVYVDRLNDTEKLNHRVPNLQRVIQGVQQMISDTMDGTISDQTPITNPQDLLNYFNVDNTNEIINEDDITDLVAIPEQVLNLGTITANILCYDLHKHLSSDVPDVLYANIQNYLNEYRILTDDVIIRPGKVINFGVIFDVVAHKYAQKGKVKTQCIEKIKEYFDIDKQQFRTPIYCNQLEFELMNIEGVRAVNYVTITQDKDWRATDTPDVFNLGDSPGLYTKIFDSDSGTFVDMEDNPGYGYQYDFSQFYDTSTVGSSINGDGVILPSVEPSVFELKYPNKQIKGIVR